MYGASTLPNGGHVQVRVAPDPQLVVCKGVVADRLRKLKSGRPILGWRCCRASYGTICRMEYNPQHPQHYNKPTVRDPMDGKLYVCGVVDWYVLALSHTNPLTDGPSRFIKQVRRVEHRKCLGTN